MTNLFVLYQWTILAGGLAAVSLALLGAQLATRDRSMQTMCVGQGAMVGVLLALGVLPEIGIEHSDLIPFLAAFGVSAATFLFTDNLAVARMASRNTAFAYTFAVLLAVGYLLSSLFPALESHMAQVYFGDLATLTNHESIATAVASLLFSTILVLGWRKWSHQSFECALFGEGSALRQSPGRMTAFRFLTLSMLCVSVQFLGFLFTISLLFLPTGILSRMRTKGLALHLTLCASVSLVASVSGFLLSLNYTRLPTVPTIAICLTLLSGAVLGVERLVARPARRRADALVPVEAEA